MEGLALVHYRLKVWEDAKIKAQLPWFQAEIVKGGVNTFVASVNGILTTFDVAVKWDMPYIVEYLLTIPEFDPNIFGSVPDVEYDPLCLIVSWYPPKILGMLIDDPRLKLINQENPKEH